MPYKILQDKVYFRLDQLNSINTYSRIKIKIFSLQCLLIEFTLQNLIQFCICVSKIFKTFKTGFSIINNPMNLCVRVGNSMK